MGAGRGISRHFAAFRGILGQERANPGRRRARRGTVRSRHFGGTPPPCFLERRGGWVAGMGRWEMGERRKGWILNWGSTVAPPPYFLEGGWRMVGEWLGVGVDRRGAEGWSGIGARGRAGSGDSLRQRYRGAIRGRVGTGGTAGRDCCSETIRMTTICGSQSRNHNTPAVAKIKQLPATNGSGCRAGTQLYFHHRQAGNIGEVPGIGGQQGKAPLHGLGS